MQGAFILIGSSQAEKPILAIMAAAIGTYSAWRFWEAITGQGYDDTYPKWKNFFKFRCVVYSCF